MGGTGSTIEYRAKYKCRMCGAIIVSAGVHEKPLNFQFVQAEPSRETIALPGGSEIELRLFARHICSTGDVGLADLIGFGASVRKKQDESGPKN